MLERVRRPHAGACIDQRRRLSTVRLRRTIDFVDYVQPSGEDTLVEVEGTREARPQEHQDFHQSTAHHRL